MITELVLILGFLAFLCVRPDHVKRRALFVLAVLAWGGARLFTEINFGDSQYVYGTWLSYAAAVSLVICVLAMFFACVDTCRSRPEPGEGRGETDQDAETELASSPSDRLRKIISEKE